MPSSSGCRADGLTGLPADRFLRVLDALTLVRLRRTELAYRGRRLAEYLTIGTLERHDRLLVDLGVDAFRELEHDRVRVAEREMQLAAFRFGAVADAVDLEHAAEAGADARHHVRDELASEAVRAPCLARVVATSEAHVPLGDLHLDVRTDARAKLPLGAGDAHLVVLDRERHAGRQRDGLFADTRHRYLTTPSTAARRR